jgi:hypothetical protein
MREGRINVSAQGVRHRQSVLHVFLPGLKFVCLAQVLNRPLILLGIEAGHPQGVVVVGGLGRRRLTSDLLAAKTKVHPGALGNFTSPTFGQLGEKLRRPAEILLLKSSHSRFEILDSRMILGVNLRSRGTCRRPAPMIGSTLGSGSAPAHMIM